MPTTVSSRLLSLAASAIALNVASGAPGAAASDVYECTVKEHLMLTEKGYKPSGEADVYGGRQIMIDKFSGNALGPIFSNSSVLEWKRIRKASEYDTFYTVGYNPGGKAVEQIFVQDFLGKGPKTVFVAISEPDLGVFTGTCR